MATLEHRLHADLTEALKAREEIKVATLRMALAAVQVESVAGKEARTLDDAEVQRVLAREVKKRREAAEAFAGAGRAESAAREVAESAVLQAYLPQPLTDAEVAALVDEVVAETGASGPRETGAVIKAVMARAAGRAEGGRVAALVRARLSG